MILRAQVVRDRFQTTILSISSRNPQLNICRQCLRHNRFFTSTQLLLKAPNKSNAAALNIQRARARAPPPLQPGPLLQLAKSPTDLLIYKAPSQARLTLGSYATVFLSVAVALGTAWSLNHDYDRFYSQGRVSKVAYYTILGACAVWGVVAGVVARAPNKMIQSIYAIPAVGRRGIRYIRGVRVSVRKFPWQKPEEVTYMVNQLEVREEELTAVMSSGEYGNVFLHYAAMMIGRQGAAEMKDKVTGKSIGRVDGKGFFLDLGDPMRVLFTKASK